MAPINITNISRHKVQTLMTELDQEGCEVRFGRRFKDEENIQHRFQFLMVRQWLL